MLAYGDYNVQYWLAYLIGCLLVMTASSSPRWRERIQARLGRLGDSAGKLAGAAGVACLVGDVDPSTAVKEAAAQFRSIRLSLLSPEELATNKPIPALYLRTVGGVRAWGVRHVFEP